MEITINTVDFSEHISDGFAYVDKTGMLSELAGSRDVFLVTRPRRFGKTMNLSMIHSFFSNEKEFGEIESLFSNLAVWGDKKAWGMLASILWSTSALHRRAAGHGSKCSRNSSRWLPVGLIKTLIFSKAGR